ncbi:MAG TPA: winged helix-turn-helix domain-containing protein [Gemmatimonadaceae bacterium]|nr:winged helix-turn-helix domain-containing protein [Gemmatimonadaceae bacterium]
MQSSDANDERLGLNGFVAGDWTVAPSRNLLVRGDRQVRVEPRVMDVLVYLAEHADHVVSKNELRECIWKALYLTDDVLTVTIYALRKALGDDARRPQYIETVPRRGYRWIAPVQLIAPEPVRMKTDAPKQPEGRRWPRKHSWPTVAAAVALALFAAGALRMIPIARHRRHVPTAEAHAAYLKGRYFLDQRSIYGWQQALEQFERAIALDPQDPAAQAGLADTYAAMSDFGVASPAEMHPRAMKAAERALELDPKSAEGQEALGRAQFLFDWNFAAAERSLARAVTLNPDYMPAHQAIAWVKSARGQYAEAIAAAERALQLDPVNTARYTELAWVLALGGRHGEALREVERALQLDPRSSGINLTKGWVLELSGQPDSAFAAYRDAIRLSGAPEVSLQHIEAVYRAEGLAGFFRSSLNRRGGGTPMSDTFRAQLYARAGEPDRAIESLERAYEKREGALAWVNVEPSFRPLRSDARFQQIAAHVGPRN